MKKSKKKTSINNLVAKHCRTFNKATVEVDRKKEAKIGRVKYKKDIFE